MSAEAAGNDRNGHNSGAPSPRPAREAECAVRSGSRPYNVEAFLKKAAIAHYGTKN